MNGRPQSATFTNIISRSKDEHNLVYIVQQDGKIYVLFLPLESCNMCREHIRYYGNFIIAVSSVQR